MGDSAMAQAIWHHTGTGAVSPCFISMGAILLVQPTATLRCCYIVPYGASCLPATDAADSLQLVKHSAAACASYVHRSLHFQEWNLRRTYDAQAAAACFASVAALLTLHASFAGVI